MKTITPLRPPILALATTFLLLGAATAQAQERWGFEFRVDGAVATRDIGTDDPGAGFGFEGNVSYDLLPHLATYLGWDWHRFTPDAVFDRPALDLEETGYVLGLRWAHPFAGEDAGTFGYWVRAGVTWNHVELEDDAGDRVADSGHGAGFEAGLGVTVPLGESWVLTPGVRYRALSRDVELDGTSRSVDLGYMTLGVGLRTRF